MELVEKDLTSSMCDDDVDEDENELDYVDATGPNDVHDVESPNCKTKSSNK